MGTLDKTLPVEFRDNNGRPLLTYSEYFDTYYLSIQSHGFTIVRQYVGNPVAHYQVV